MKTLMIYFSISLFFMTESICFGQNYKLFKLNNITFTIDTFNYSKNFMAIYNELVENPVNPSMSFLNGNPPADPYRSPWSPSTFYYWYFYLPYADTLNISLSNSVEEINSEPKKFYLDKGMYVLTSNSKDADLIKVSSIYRISISFCDTTYNRGILVLK
jgi:hypothetical protein